MSSIGLIKRRNAGSGKVEVYELRRGASDFSIRTVTPISLTDDPNFTYDFKANYGGDHHLAAIKTKNSDTGTVEVHLLNRSSSYQSFLLNTGTPITLDDAPNFDFMLGVTNGDLVCVKRRNTATGKVEVHVLSRSSNYQDFIVQRPTSFAVEDADNYDFLSVAPDRVDTLVGVKRQNTAGSIEIHPLGSGYGPLGTILATKISLEEGLGTTFLYDSYYQPYPTSTATQLLVQLRGKVRSGRMQIVDSQYPFTTTWPTRQDTIMGETDMPNYTFKYIQLGRA